MSRRGQRILVMTDVPKLPGLENLPTRTADEYLEAQAGTTDEDLIVVNLCRSYQYLSKGYYVSLLADARHQRVFPSLLAIEEVSNPFAWLTTLREAGVKTLDLKEIRRRKTVPIRAGGAGGVAGAGASALRAVPAPGSPAVAVEEVKPPAEALAVLGRCRDERFRKRCAAIFRVYGFPLLRVRLQEHDDTWKVAEIVPASPAQAPREDLALLAEELTSGRFAAGRPKEAAQRPWRVACLFDPADPFAPSDEDAIDRFARAASRQGVLFERIGRDDLARLAEYDGLFIRTVTGLDHPSFAFAQKAQALGMAVIDDPASIVRCSNKVFLHELFRRAGIPTPRTLTVSRKTPLDEITALGSPLIVKLPDGTFSGAVKKAEGKVELQALMASMFPHSPLLIVQEFAPTSFDWRIGVLDGRILFTCKYHMAKAHWQIISRTASGATRFGKVEAVKVEDVPEPVRRVALDAAALIGNGLYGVDVKETAAGPVIIEVNDNPNIDAGGEDQVEKERLYDDVIRALVRRMLETSGGAPAE